MMYLQGLQNRLVYAGRTLRNFNELTSHFGPLEDSYGSPYKRCNGSP